ncbi:MAG TPA: DNA repair protein RecN [Bacteroidota bacterium]|nr:DNA repair protein RecN [Bacteroidota bacterium]
MLRNLSIKNYALIDQLDAAFGPGLNIVTGETGAGKTIIIDAVGLILGERGDAAAVRQGAEKAVVEGIFTVSGNRNIERLLRRNDIDEGEDLILRREVSAKGQGRAFINDTPATLALLKEAGELLVDLHGQHEHQSLLRIATHLALLDEYGRLGALAAEFAAAFADGVKTRTALRALRAREDLLRERRSLVEFQLGEIDAVAPEQDEEQRLERELIVLENAETLFSATERLYRALYDGENAVHDGLVLARNELEDLARIDPSFADARQEASSATAIVDELSKFIQSYNSRIEFKPARLEEIRNRLGALTLLRKKYGGSLDAVIAKRSGLAAELSLSENFEEEAQKLERELAGCVVRASEIAQRLSHKRREAGKKIGSAVVAELRKLGIPNAAFEAVITNRSGRAEDSLVNLGRDWFAADETGMDIVEFHVSANAGQDPRPLSKVASGGEISRIMLALKMILAKSDRLPLLVFDEIDSGVSGRVAQSVGESMKRLSQFHQIIAITHLPQIAGCADAHYVVEKTEEKNRTATTMRLVDPDESVREVAKLMSGAEITGAALESAKVLIHGKTR